MTPDELWEKYSASDGVRFVMREDDFLAALAEYGEAVRKQAVNVCRDNKLTEPFQDENQTSYTQGSEDCAAAIEKMELP